MTRHAIFVGCGALAALITAGCGGQKNPLLVPNQPPEVELFTQRLDPNANGPFEYRLQWTGHDPDGRVDHYVYSLGSPAADPAAAPWTSTTTLDHTLSFPAHAALPVGAAPDAIEPRVFSVRAVDSRGAMSAPAQVAFFDGVLPPFVRITSPVPNQLIRYPISPDFCVEWSLVNTPPETRVAQYKYIVLSSKTEVTVATARADPDSVRRYYAPRGWPGWTTRPGPITSAILHDLAMDQDYAFVITVFDRAGNYDPIFNFNKNMLYMRVVGTPTSLPLLTVFNQYVNASGRGANPPTVVNLEIPAAQAITFNWFATPAPARRITGYRWAFDLADPDHLAGQWSQWDLATTSARIGPFNPPGSSEAHTLYIETRDDWSCTANDVAASLVVVNLNVIKSNFTRDLLIVDDTRLLLDRINPGTTCDATANRPIGNWPTQAELDTFLYARGGVPWRCYPPGTISTPGIFNGYSYDTLGTNLRILDLTVPLSTLGQYRHVLWLVDGAGALNSRPGTDTGDIGGPQTAMRYMSSATTSNTLAAYARLGGSVWLAGGGAATASMINFNRTNNDNVLPAPPTLTFSFTNNELIPGRFVYDEAHWQSEFKQFRARGTIDRYLGRFEASPGIYAGLPAQILTKTPATDPFPPNRTGQAPAVFYQTQFDIEFLSAANEVLEDLDPGPAENFQPTLDSLFKARGPSLPPDVGLTPVQSVVMTYYHGPDSTPFIHTGFSLWSFQRGQLVQLVDFVLQQIWGMSRSAPVAGPAEIGGVDARRPFGKAARPGAVTVPVAASGAARRE